MKIKIIIHTVLFLTLLVACGEKENHTQNKSHSKQLIDRSFIDKMKKTNFFTVQFLQNIIKDVPINAKTYFKSGFTSLTWPKSEKKLSEIDKHVQEVLMSQGAKALARAGIENTNNQLLFGGFNSTHSIHIAETMFRSHTGRLSAEEKGRAETAMKNAAQKSGLEYGSVSLVKSQIIKNDAIFVDTIIQGADEAAWSNFHRKLVVRLKNVVFTLEVDLEGQDNLKVSSDIAQEIIARQLK